MELKQLVYVNDHLPKKFKSLLKWMNDDLLLFSVL